MWPCSYTLEVAPDCRRCCILIDKLNWLLFLNDWCVVALVKLNATCSVIILIIESPHGTSYGCYQSVTWQTFQGPFVFLFILHWWIKFEEILMVRRDLFWVGEDLPVSKTALPWHPRTPPPNQGKCVCFSGLHRHTEKTCVKLSFIFIS